MPNNWEWNDSLSVITGAGSGIGKALSLRLANKQSTLVLLDKNLDACRATANDCEREGTKAFAYQLDVSDSNSYKEISGSIISEHGVPHLLVNNAGVGLSGKSREMSLDDWDWILGINLKGLIHGCHFFASEMCAKKRGHIVNMSSGLAYSPRATEIGYVTAKAAVLAYSRCLRAELKAFGLGASAICPGVINTPIISSTRFLGERNEPKVIEKVQKIFSRIGHSPDLVAKAIIRAVNKDLAVVPVGFESYFAYFMSKVSTSKMTDKFASSKLFEV
jgi:2-hydroxycyclohexanecarboxyl-CoA dehydrogenase